MTGTGGAPRTLDEYLELSDQRLTSLERRKRNPILASLARRVRDISERLGGLENDVRDLEADTGWVNLSSYLGNNYTASHFEGRRIGKTVQLRGIVSGTIPSATSATAIASLPAAWRPTRLSWGTAYNAGYAGSALMRDNGSFDIGQRTGSSWTQVYFTVVYFLG